MVYLADVGAQSEGDVFGLVSWINLLAFPAHHHRNAVLHSLKANRSGQAFLAQASVLVIPGQCPCCFKALSVIIKL
jgi:hypothetical protein